MGQSREGTDESVPSERPRVLAEGLADFQRHRPSFLHLRLRHSLTDQDDQSEKLANAFIEGRPNPLSGFGGGSSSGTTSRVDSPAPGDSGPSERVSTHTRR